MFCELQIYFLFNNLPNGKNGLTGYLKAHREFEETSISVTIFAARKVFGGWRDLPLSLYKNHLRKTAESYKNRLSICQLSYLPTGCLICCCGMD